MIRLLKSIECLYVGIVVAGATTLLFDGSESIEGYEYIKFDVLSYSHINVITKVSMNKDKLYEYLDKTNKH